MKKRHENCSLRGQSRRLPVSICAWILIFCMCLAGCRTATTGQEEGTTLTLLGKRTDLGKPYMTRIFDLYEETTGNHLDLIPVEDAEYEKTAEEYFASENAPDLFLHFNNADLSRYDVEQHFYYLNEQPWVSDLTEGAKASCEDGDGNLLGLPFWESSVSGSYYNKKILEDLGLKAPASQAEFDLLCEVLLEMGYTPICWPGNGCSWMIQFAMDPIFADDPDLLDRLNRGEISYVEIPQMRDMAQWLLDAADKGWFGYDFEQVGWDQIGQRLGSGQAVMTFIWDTWFDTDFPAEGAKYSREDFALMPIFMDTAEGGTYEGGNLNMMMVNQDSPRLKEALEFLSFCAEPEHYNLAFDGISTVGCFQGMTTNKESEMVREAAASIAKKERVSVAVTRIAGYSAEDVIGAVNELLSHQTDVEGALRRMDEARIEKARELFPERFP